MSSTAALLAGRQLCLVRLCSCLVDSLIVATFSCSRSVCLLVCLELGYPTVVSAPYQHRSSLESQLRFFRTVAVGTGAWLPRVL
ncbi:hypothetical protein COO60DRAFT_1292343 [Scenedesmus sp. NREL 46B-D3]|nr:hypothetical protein COO60DRAFT_1292343 [Scenedesmus sp. NREL 46B-D3]